ncbi:hypothetical protein CDD81_6684 [Ophiocordyceps australis]|uniref:Endoplasmic reticulum-based factor for assembly of V-ATPase n=1 Tax=Ophiocordyceps australis TaxID=1399860 RepID=A0A2C5Y6D7_9HYPO|nr:hypothetical protein CDD81_6684 [Ophiocordyceps australis]
MVLLTMTRPVVDVLSSLDTCSLDTCPSHGSSADEPPLHEPAIGKPISHAQLLALWRKLQSSPPMSASSPYCLEQLLSGSSVFLPPPPPKPEPSAEYKALMARLRREEAARTYERMMKQPLEARLPAAAQSFAAANRPTSSTDLGDDDVTYAEVHRHLVLILNFIASIVGVAATLWIAARWWSLPARFFLTLGGSILVAVAEVIVYQGYIWRLSQAKSKQQSVQEVKKVVSTWVVGKTDD